MVCQYICVHVRSALLRAQTFHKNGSTWWNGNPNCYSPFLTIKVIGGIGTTWKCRSHTVAVHAAWSIKGACKKLCRDYESDFEGTMQLMYQSTHGVIATMSWFKDIYFMYIIFHFNMLCAYEMVCKKRVLCRF